MPGATTHVIAGLATGTTAGCFAAASLPEGRRVPEVALAAIGGTVGGLLPDMLEPATSPNHRDLCHGVVLTSIVCIGLFSLWKGACRQRAAQCDERALAAAGNTEIRTTEESAAAAWRALGAFLLGVACGYGSHVALDSATPDGVPLFARGF